MEKDADKLTNEEETKYCFLRISVAGNDPKTVVIQLDVDTCPLTCRNFCAICASPYRASRPRKNELGRGEVPPPPPTYRGTDFHRVIPSFMVQGGDYENFDGSGGGSAVAAGSYFKDENLHSRKHDREGIVSMANRGPNTNGSQFFITLGRGNHLDGKHVAFGEVILGMDVVRLMAGVECVGERPCAMQRITVVDCGIGRGEKRAESNPKKLKGGCRGREYGRSRSRSRDRDRKERKQDERGSRDQERSTRNREKDRSSRRSRDDRPSGGKRKERHSRRDCAGNGSRPDRRRNDGDDKRRRTSSRGETDGSPDVTGHQRRRRSAPSVDTDGGRRKKDKRRESPSRQRKGRRRSRSRSRDSDRKERRRSKS